MKIINSFVLLIILVCGSQLSHGEKLKCEFIDKDYDHVGSFYTCFASSLDNPNNNLRIDGYLGEHMINKNDEDVKVIWIQDTNTKYIPTNLGSFSNLTALMMHNTQLVEIKAKDFHGMQDLQCVSVYRNKLSSVPSDAFTLLTKLRFIFLSSNQIEELPNDIFKNNLDLEVIHLYNNRIKYLGTEMFNDLKKLDFVSLLVNICVSKTYKGATEINQLKDDIKMKCMNPNENPATTTTTTTTTPRTTTTSLTQTPTTTTTQNPMAEKLIEMKEQNAKLEKELREAKEQQQTNEDALKKELREAKEELREAKEQQETNEDALKKQLREAKELQQTNEDAMKKELREAKELQNKNEDAMKKELREAKELQQNNEDAMKKELKEAKQMVERIPKLERETYDLNKNIFDIKEQRRIERSAFIEVKEKLNRAEEQLASCEKDPAETLIDLRHSRNVNEI